MYSGHGDRCFAWPTSTRLLYCGTFLAPVCLFLFINIVMVGFLLNAVCSKKLRTKTPPISPKEASIYDKNLHRHQVYVSLVTYHYIYRYLELMYGQRDIQYFTIQYICYMIY